MFLYYPQSYTVMCTWRLKPFALFVYPVELISQKNPCRCINRIEFYNKYCQILVAYQSEHFLSETMFNGPLLVAFDILGRTIMLGYSLPLKWDRLKFRFHPYNIPKKNELEVVTGRHEKFYYSTILGIHRVVFLVLTIQLMLALGKSSSSQSNIMCWVAWVMWTVYHSFLNFCHRRCGNIVTLLNGLLEFSENMAPHWRDKQRTITEKLNILCSTSAPIFMAFLSVGYVYGLHWTNPYQPTLVGYWLLDNNKSLTGVLLKLGILFFNFWIWISMSLGGVLCDICLQILCPLAIRDCIHLFNMIEENPETVAFQRRCIVYRRLQILGALFNHLQAGALMTTLIMTATAVLPLSLVLAARSAWTSENIPRICSGLYLAVLCLVGIVFVIGGYAGVWSESREMFERLDTLNGTRYLDVSRWERRCQERFWKSCRNFVKVKFGVNNYVEEQTPLNCLNCSASLAIQLLILVR